MLISMLIGMHWHAVFWLPIAPCKDPVEEMQGLHLAFHLQVQLRCAEQKCHLPGGKKRLNIHRFM